MESIKKFADSKLFDIVNILFLTILGIITLYPFYYILIYSFSIPNLAAGGVYLLPKGFTLENYIKV